jgi:hypothetical protein
MISKRVTISTLVVVLLLGAAGAAPVALADMRPDEMLMPSAMPTDKQMVSKKDFLDMAGKMWDKAAANMKVKDMKMMTMDEYKNFYDSYLKR